MKVFSRSLTLAGLLAAVAIGPFFHHPADMAPDPVIFEPVSAFREHPDGVLCVSKKLILPKKKEDTGPSIHAILAQYGE